MLINGEPEEAAPVAVAKPQKQKHIGALRYGLPI